jgi:predicted Zn-dependent protease
MLKRFAALILASIFIAITSCTVSPGYSYTVVIDPVFSQQNKEAIHAAIAGWEHITEGEFIVSSVSTGPCNSNIHSICFSPSTEAEIDAIRGTTKGDIIGLTARTYSNDNSVIYIPLDATANFDLTAMITVMAHELGHALGLEHTQTGTVMCWSIQCDAPLPNCDDLQQWLDVRSTVSSNFVCPNGGHYTLTGM